MWAMGITQHIVGVRNVMDLANLQMLLGNMGIPGGGVNPLRGQNCVQGACDPGGLPNVYPGYQQVTDEGVRKKFEAAWGVPLCNHLGSTVTEMMPAMLEGKTKGLYILGEDPVMSEPNSNHIRHCLEACEFVLIQEIFPSETSPCYAGVSHERLEWGERLQWPVKDATHPGTPILHVSQFARGRGKFVPVEHIPPAEMPDDEYPFLLSTGRVLYHWHGGEMTRRARGLLEVYRKALVEINPDDAERFGLNGHRRVRITSRRGQIEAAAWVTDRVPPGMIFANFHFPGDQNANVLTIAALDPVAKIPEYKVCAVKLELIS